MTQFEEFEELRAKAQDACECASHANKRVKELQDGLPGLRQQLSDVENLIRANESTLAPHSSLSEGTRQRTAAYLGDLRGEAAELRSKISQHESDAASALSDRSRFLPWLVIASQIEKTFTPE